MSRKVGVIGQTGRMGTLLTKLLSEEQSYELGLSFSRSETPEEDLVKVFQENDLVIDFSSSELLKYTLEAALRHPKPFIICTTGWCKETFESLIHQLAHIVPIVIAPNTSIGAVLQLYLATQLAEILDESYDIDILEKHHKQKTDTPSGTAKALIEAIQQSKENDHSLRYELYHGHTGPRPLHSIGLSVQRSGQLPGEHSISFTSEEESIVIHHTALNRKLFARGVLKIISWIAAKNPRPGIYSMLDVLNIR